MSFKEVREERDRAEESVEDWRLQELLLQQLLLQQLLQQELPQSFSPSATSRRSVVSQLDGSKPTASEELLIFRAGTNVPVCCSTPAGGTGPGIAALLRCLSSSLGLKFQDKRSSTTE